MSNNVHVMRMSGQTIMNIDAFEANHFAKASKLMERITKVLPQSGEVGLMYVMASSLDKTISIIYKHGEEDGCKTLPITEPGTLGNLLFLHCYTTAPCDAALTAQYGFANAYAFAQRLAVGIVAGDIDTYPKYEKRITPAMVQESEEYQVDLYRFAFVGQSRTDDHTEALAVTLRYTALSVGPETSNNVNEIFAVFKAGPYITFNSYVPYSAQILGPYSNECILPAATKYDLLAKDAIIPTSEKPVMISVASGMEMQPEYQTIMSGV